MPLISLIFFSGTTLSSKSTRLSFSILLHALVFWPSTMEIAHSDSLVNAINFSLSNLNSMHFTTDLIGKLFICIEVCVVIVRLRLLIFLWFLHSHGKSVLSISSGTDHESWLQLSPTFINFCCSCKNCTDHNFSFQFYSFDMTLFVQKFWGLHFIKNHAKNTQVTPKENPHLIKLTLHPNHSRHLLLNKQKTFEKKHIKTEHKESSFKKWSENAFCFSRMTKMLLKNSQTKRLWNEEKMHQSTPLFNGLWEEVIISNEV